MAATRGRLAPAPVLRIRISRDSESCVLAFTAGEGPSPNRLYPGTESGVGTIYSLSRKSTSFAWSQEITAAPQMSTQ